MRKLFNPASSHCFSSALLLAEEKSSARTPTPFVLVVLPFVTPLFGIRWKADISFLRIRRTQRQ